MADISDSPHGVDELPLSFGIPKRPLPDQKVLRDFYVGKHISQVPKPAAVLDVAKIRRHCSSMLETVKELGVGFRPHVKTHKVRLDSLLDEKCQVADIYNRLPRSHVFNSAMNQQMRNSSSRL